MPDFIRGGPRLDGERSLRLPHQPTPSAPSRVHRRRFEPGTTPPELRHPLELRALDAERKA